MIEKYKYKWNVPVREVEALDIPLKSEYTVKSGHGKTTITNHKQGVWTQGTFSNCGLRVPFLSVDFGHPF